MRETQSQYHALQQAWQNFNDSASDELLANDVERLLTLANQQLRLAGNVSNAIVALETAQARLARADRPRFSSLQQAINGDLDRLRAVSTVDIPAQAARIERLSVLISKAPLLVPDVAAQAVVPAGQPVAASAPAVDPQAGLPADAPWWQRWRAEIASWPGRAGSALAHELGGLITIQRVDEPAALLLSPEQADQLRGTLRQRLLTVQLAMLMRQPAVWKSELDHVGGALAKYFDGRSPDTVAAQNVARELAQIDIAVHARGGRQPERRGRPARRRLQDQRAGLRPMRTWFWTLLLAVVAVALAVVLRSHSGNVLLLVWPWRIEMSLTLAVLLIVAAFVVLYVGLRVLAWLLAIPDRVRVWRGKRAQARDHELLERGWISLLEGRYSQAEKDLTRLLDQTKVQTRRVLAALSSARAARQRVRSP